MMMMMMLLFAGSSFSNFVGEGEVAVACGLGPLQQLGVKLPVTRPGESL